MSFMEMQISIHSLRPMLDLLLSGNIIRLFEPKGGAASLTTFTVDGDEYRVSGVLPHDDAAFVYDEDIQVLLFSTGFVLEIYPCSATKGYLGSPDFPIYYS